MFDFFVPSIFFYWKCNFLSELAIEHRSVALVGLSIGRSVKIS